MPIQKAVPVLSVADVARSIAWFHDTLGFVGDPFPPTPPHSFAILRAGNVEIMLRAEPAARLARPRPYHWNVYLRLEDTPFRDVFQQLLARRLVTRRLELMPYGLAEFEITDPDGHVICLSQHLPDANDLPTPTD